MKQKPISTNQRRHYLTEQIMKNQSYVCSEWQEPSEVWSINTQIEALIRLSIIWSHNNSGILKINQEAVGRY